MCANRLKDEMSPYLRQHAQNPVDWYPWGKEALERAKAQDKPILLSIGYSACHWCHVMAHECFENADIAKLMNDHFINIKVDREQRPDLDQIYQHVCQLLTRSGGWPLTVFLTPDLKPYYGGTYFPPYDAQGRPGFPKVLATMADAYANQREAVAENSGKLMDAISQIENSLPTTKQSPNRAGLRTVVDKLTAEVDWRTGGFGKAPKFPVTTNFTFLWRFGCSADIGMTKEAALSSLKAMASHGLYDHVGGGFHRYCVDETWTVPHFEKMLYDNALLIKLYAEVLLTAPSGDLSAEDTELFTNVLSQTTAYVLREMSSPDGAFYSSQDADTEGHEGSFYLWTPQDVRSAMDETHAKAFCLRFGVNEKGNFENTGKTVLHLAQKMSDIAEKLSVDETKARELIEQATQMAFSAREKRAKPFRDEKILCSWNGLMISALCWASRALSKCGRPEEASKALECAKSAMGFLRKNLNQKTDRLISVYGTTDQGFLDDYANSALAALELARTTDDKDALHSLLEQAQHWCKVAIEHFEDERGGFFLTADDHEKLIQRPKMLFDQAQPSGNSTLLSCLAVLGELFEESGFAEKADYHLNRLFDAAIQAPFGTGELSTAALLWQMGPVIVSGQNASRLCTHPHVFHGVASKELPAGQVMVCHQRKCEIPTEDIDAARKLALKKTIYAD